MAAKQSIVLTGLGSTAFDANVNAIMEIHSYLSDNLPVGVLQSWQPKRESDYACLEFSNRYMTKLADATGFSEVALGQYVDPNNVIKNTLVEGRHTEDNVVLYFERVGAEETQYVVLSAGHANSMTTIS